MIKIENQIFNYSNFDYLNYKNLNQNINKEKKDSSIFQRILNEEILKTEKPKSLSLKRGIIIDYARKIN